MSRRTTVTLLHCLLFAFILSASARRHHRRLLSPRGTSPRETRVRRPTKCLQLEYLLKKAYHAQVDLIRRGLPTHIIQSEFTYAINFFISINTAFKYKPLKGTCIRNEEWSKVFDQSFRANFAVKYLNGIRALVKTITFLSFESYTTLPPLEPSKEELVETMWRTCVVRLHKRPRTRYRVSDFPFPKNVDILHDPERDRACQQFNKFKSRSHPENDPDARSVLAALTIVSINLQRSGANIRSIAQMLKHFIGFVFNGIRCTHLEGADIKVPRALLEAYSRNIAMIGSTSTSDDNKRIFRVKPEAVMRVFSRDFRSLLSYNCWGHLLYAELSKTTSLPFKVNFLARIFGGTQYRLLLLYSRSRSLPDGQTSTTRSSKEIEENPVSMPTGALYAKCDEGYVLMPRQVTVQDPLESCCNTICYRWSLLIPGYVTYSAEGCCARCNQLNRCDSRITQRDLSDNNFYSFIIPKYGEQSQIEMFLVAL